MDILQFLIYTLVPALILPCLLFFGFYISDLIKKKKVVRYPSKEWLLLTENPIPQKVEGEILASDGKKVKYIDRIRWAPHGKIWFEEYDKTFVTHWMPMPEAPTK